MEVVYRQLGLSRPWKHKLHEVAWMPIVPSPATLPFSPSLHLLPHAEFSIISWQRKKRLGPSLHMVLHNMQVPLCRRQLQHYSLFLKHSWRVLVKGNPPSGQNSNHCPGSLCLKKKWPDMYYISIHELWLMVWLGGQRLERNMSGKLVTKKFGDVCISTSQNRWKMPRYLCVIWMLTTGQP